MAQTSISPPARARATKARVASRVSGSIRGMLRVLNAPVISPRIWDPTVLSPAGHAVQLVAPGNRHSRSVDKM